MSEPKDLDGFINHLLTEEAKKVDMAYMQSKKNLSTPLNEVEKERLYGLQPLPYTPRPFFGSVQDVIDNFQYALANKLVIPPYQFAQYCFATNKTIGQVWAEIENAWGQADLGFNPAEALTNERKQALEEEMSKLSPNSLKLFELLSEYTDIVEGFWTSSLLETGEPTTAGIEKDTAKLTTVELLEHGQRLAEWGVTSHMILIATALFIESEKTDKITIGQSDAFIIFGCKGTDAKMCLHKSWVKKGCKEFDNLPSAEVTAGTFRSRSDSETIRKYFPLNPFLLEAVLPHAQKLFEENLFLSELLDFGYLLPSEWISLPADYPLSRRDVNTGMNQTETIVITPSSYPFVYITTNGDVYAVYHTAYDALTIQKGLSLAAGERYWTKAITLDWYYANVMELLPVAKDGYERIKYKNFLGEEKYLTEKDVRATLHHQNYPFTL